MMELEEEWEWKAAEEMKIREFNIIRRYVTQFIRANKHPRTHKHTSMHKWW